MKSRLLSCFILLTACSSSSPATNGGNGGGGSSGGAGGAAGMVVSGGSGGGGSGGSAGSTTAIDAGPPPKDASSAGGAGGQIGKDAAAPPPRVDASAEGVQACQAFAHTFCAKLESCAAFVLGVLYGDAATCEKRVALSCVPSFQAPGTSATPAKTTACEQSLAALACAQFIKGDLGAGCTTQPGTVAANGPCTEDAQCASAFCARGPDAACGVCAPPTKPGDPCVNGACSTGSVCPKTGSTMGTTCIAPVAGQKGAACTAQEQCDLAHGVGCNVTTKQCLPLTLSTAGGSCGADGLIATTYAVCPASGSCSAVLAGKCSAAAADGEACSSADTGKHCLPPARCVGGKCTLVDPASCH